MAEIKVYTSNFCGYCTAAKQLLTSRGYQFEEINVQGDQDLMLEVMQKSGQRTMPPTECSPIKICGIVR